MASPVGHALAGFALGRLGEGSEPPGGRLFLPVCVALALAPDLDFLPGVLAGQPAAYHQGESHSLVVALVVSLGAALVLVRDRLVLLRGWSFFFAAYVSHLVLDYLGKDARPPIGIPLLWPLHDAAWLSPVTLLPGVHHAVSGQEGISEWLSLVFSWVNLQPVLAELALVGPLVLAAELLRRRGKGLPCGGAESPGRR